MHLLHKPCTLYRRRVLITSLAVKKRAGAACYGEDRGMSLACLGRGAAAGKDAGSLRWMASMQHSKQRRHAGADFRRQMSVRQMRQWWPFWLEAGRTPRRQRTRSGAKEMRTTAWRCFFSTWFSQAWVWALLQQGSRSATREHGGKHEYRAEQQYRITLSRTSLTSPAMNGSGSARRRGGDDDGKRKRRKKNLIYYTRDFPN